MRLDEIIKTSHFVLLVSEITFFLGVFEITCILLFVYRRGLYQKLKAKIKRKKEKQMS